MHTICPNCLRPVRAGAKYCGFCGTTLNSPDETSAATSAVLQGQAVTDLEAGTHKLPGPTYNETSRTVAVVAIILLILVIIFALVIRNWSVILAWLGQIIPGLNIQ